MSVQTFQVLNIRVKGFSIYWEILTVFNLRSKTEYVIIYNSGLKMSDTFSPEPLVSCSPESQSPMTPSKTYWPQEEERMIIMRDTSATYKMYDNHPLVVNLMDVNSVLNIYAWS